MNDLLKKLDDDIVSETSDLFKYLDDNPSSFEAWASVKKYHPDLAKNVPSLQSFNHLKQNPSFGKMGLIDESLAKINGYEKPK